MDLTDFQIGLVATIASGSFVFSALILGARIVDIGEYRFIKWTLIATSILNATMGFVVYWRIHNEISAGFSWILVVLLRAFLSILWGGMYSAIQVGIVRAVSADNRLRAIAAVGIAISAGTTFGPIAGGLLLKMGTLVPFLFVAATSASPIIFGWSRLKGLYERIDDAQFRPGQLPSSLTMIAKRGTRYFITGALLAASLSALQYTTAFRFQDLYGLPASQAAAYAGIILSVMACGLVFSQLVIVKQARGASPSNIIFIGSICGLLGCVFASLTQMGSLASATILQGIAMFIIGIALGSVFPANGAALSQNFELQTQGKAAGLLSAAHGVGSSVGPIIGIAAYRIFEIGPYLAAATCFSIICLFGLLNRSPMHQVAP